MKFRQRKFSKEILEEKFQERKCSKEILERNFSQTNLGKNCFVLLVKRNLQREIIVLVKLIRR